MKLEKFNYGNIKRSRWFLYGFIMCAVLMVLINLFFSHAKYLNTESIKLAEGSITYKPYDFKIMAIYSKNEDGNYELINTMPTGNYIINEEKSYCTLDNINKDTNAILKTVDRKHIISNLSYNDKCYLYFDKNTKIVSTTLGSIEISLETPHFDKASCTEGCEEATVGIFEGEDDDGTTYYFRGDVDNNWVQFAGFYWRIIRINGNGSIRMIYAGTSTTATGYDTGIAKDSYSKNESDNAYVGYMYGTPGSSTYEATHANIHDSHVKTVIDNWYEQNLTAYTSYLDINVGFCNDRTAYVDAGGNPGLGYGQYVTYYGASVREYRVSPTLKCPQTNDLFTTVNSEKGNKALTYPIGLITADEAWFAGAQQAKNNNFYLNDNSYSITMSPGLATYYHAVGNSPFLSYVSSLFPDGFLGTRPSSASWGAFNIRPVINLRVDVTLTGSGTSTNPYIVS